MSSPLCIFDCYGFTSIFGGATDDITTVIDQFDLNFSISLIVVQNSSIQFCTLLTNSYKIICLSLVGYDLTSKIGHVHVTPIEMSSVLFVYGYIPYYTFTKWLCNWLQMISPLRPSCFSRFHIENWEETWKVDI